MQRTARLGQGLMRSATRTFAVCALVTPKAVSAQGMDDWGMWFGTLIIIAVPTALVAVLICLIRRLRR
jgi:hypothetical protein